MAGARRKGTSADAGLTPASTRTIKVLLRTLAAVRMMSADTLYLGLPERITIIISGLAVSVFRHAGR